MGSRADRMSAQMAKEFGGTFVPENRSQIGCIGSTEFTPDIAEEEARIIRSDHLRTRRPNKTFRSKSVVNEEHWGRSCKVVETRDEWMLGAPFVPLDEIVDPWSDFQLPTDDTVDDDEE